MQQMPEIPAGLSAPGAPPRPGRGRGRVVNKAAVPQHGLSGEPTKHIDAVTPAVDLTKAKTETEGYKARLARLQYETRVGQLLVAEDVARATSQCGAAIVQQIDRLPLAAEDLAAAFTTGGLPELRAALRRLARDTRASIAADLRRLESGG